MSDFFVGEQMVLDVSGAGKARELTMYHLAVPSRAARERETDQLEKSDFAERRKGSQELRIPGSGRISIPLCFLCVALGYFPLRFHPRRSE